MAHLEGKVAIVTGAGRGIGRGEALLLAKHGAKIVVNDPGAHFDGTGGETKVADQVVQEIKAAGGEAVASYEPVNDFNLSKKIIQKALDSFGRLDILVNNAGILRDKMSFNLSEEDWDSVISVHLKGTFNCTKHAAEYWRAEHKAGKTVKGRIINTTSDAGLLGNPGQSNYGAAKAAIAAFTIIVAQELQRYGITVNAVAPVARTRLTTDATPSLAALFSQKPPEGQFDILAPENIAPMVAYLASDDAQNITGQVFRVAGDTIWLLGGWHSIGKIKNDKKRWEPEQIGPKLKELLKNAPPREDMTTPLRDMMSGG